MINYDVVVVGGGPAGLSAATVLGRSRRSVLVIDAGRPRNVPADAVHSFLSRDGIAPADLLEVARKEVARYGGQLHHGDAISGRRTHTGFEITLGDASTVTSRRLVVTTGLRDALPAVPGLRELWGQRRRALPLLPRVGGPRPSHRGAGHRTNGRAPSDAVPSAQR